MENLGTLCEIKVSSLKIYGIKEICIFGSYAPKENSKNSDIDILVEFIEVQSLLQMVHIDYELSEKLNIKVDLLTKGAKKNEFLYRSIMNDIRYI